MKKYIDTLSTKQKANVEFMINRMAEKGITNPFIQAGILAVVSKESSFLPKTERAYSGTSNDRIRKIFGRRVFDQSEAQLTALKKDAKKFFDKIYGGRYGNAADEGFKYRGRGLNQLTFKTNYAKVNSYTDVDVVKFPDKVNELSVATDLLIGYFKNAFSSSSAKLSAYNMIHINDVKSAKDGVGAAYNANAGWGKSKAEIERDTTGGFKKATNRVDAFYELTKKAAGTSTPDVPIATSTDIPIKFHKSNVVPFAKELQEFLNQFPKIKLKPDGKPGNNTSAAFKKVMGYYLIGDPRIK